jgi:ABC-type bacteriocin/lantibiotic exporter with double-glycine peptidase domain
LLALPALLLSACAGPTANAPRTPALAHASDWTTVGGVPLVKQQGRSDCGSAALAMVLGHFDPNTNPAEIRAALGPLDDNAPSSGLTAGSLRDLARQRGLEAYVIQASFADLRNELERGHPVLVGLYRIIGNRGYPHYEVIAGINPRDEKVLTADPATGWREESFQKFGARWGLSKSLAIVIFPPEERPLAKK